MPGVTKEFASASGAGIVHQKRDLAEGCEGSILEPLNVFSSTHVGGDGYDMVRTFCRFGNQRTVRCQRVPLKICEATLIPISAKCLAAAKPMPLAPP